ncbi:unnamed protein product [Allacma fusca]|uniref:Uncharacterized protein n=1 Tax=Allacma fusca TaxID=39272 RepID=A0A8J2NVR4_9HEXA|nr:unnamed protein product [Allacma fusca]
MGEPGSGSTSSDPAGGSGSGGGGGSGDEKVSPEHHRWNPDTLDPAVVAAMTADELKKFIDTGRTGRRNALPDVSAPDAVTTSTAGVAEAMESLSMQNNKEQSSSDGGS